MFVFVTASRYAYGSLQTIDIAWRSHVDTLACTKIKLYGTGNREFLLMGWYSNTLIYLVRITFVCAHVVQIHKI